MRGDARLRLWLQGPSFPFFVVASNGISQLEPLAGEPSACPAPAAESQEAASFCCAHTPRRQGHRVRGPGNRPGRPLRRTPGVHGRRPAPIHAQGAPVVARSNERPRKMLRRCRWSSTSVRHGIERARLVVVLARSSTQPGCSEGNAMRLCIDQIKRRGKPQASRRWHGH